MHKLNSDRKTKKNVSMHIGQKSSLAEDQQNGEDNNQFYLGVDPDLSKDEEIVFHKDKRTVSRTSMSAKSRKSLQSGRVSEGGENIVRSRGRPIKPHETEPFLSIDNLPPEKSFVSDKSAFTANTGHSRASKPLQQARDESLDAQLQRMSAYMTPYSQQTPAPPSPSVVTGHLYTNRARSSDGRRSSPRKSQRSRPGTESAQTPVQKTPEKLTTIENDESDAVPINDPNSENLPKEKNDLTGSITDVSEIKKSKLSRPISAPAVGSTSESNSKKIRPGSEKSGPVSRPGIGSIRSRVSSARSRSGAGSRAGQNVFGIRSVQSRAGRITPANTPYHSPNKLLRPPNHHVKTPFKHAVNQPEFGLDGRQTPSMGMKERTAMAAFHVHKMLSVAGEKGPHKVTGRLQKGKLKPLYPVNVNGPTIDKCRGIVSETRSYQPSPSRTLQRRVNLMNQIPNVHEYLYDRPRTVESVHQTSIASSIDENFDVEALDSNRSLPDEILYRQDKSILEPRAPENTFLPESTQDEIIDGVQTMGMHVSPRMFATEIGTKDDDSATVTDMTVPSQVQHELHLSDSGTTLQETDDVITDDKNNSNQKDSDPKQSNEQRARIGSPSKSVRFAEQRKKLQEPENSKEIKQLENESIAQQQRDSGGRVAESLTDIGKEGDVDDSAIETVSRKNKQNSKGSCKDDDDDKIIFKKDDNDDDDSRGGSKDDNRKSTDNSRVGNTSENISGTKDNGDNKENVSGNSSGQKRPISSSQTRSLSSETRQRSRSKDRSDKQSGKKLQVRKSDPSTPNSKKQDSKSGRCSRFEQSKASKSHTNTLEVSSVLHGNRVTTVLGPESPKRGRSRSVSPNRGQNQTFQFFSQKNIPCFEEVDDFSSLYGNSHRSKVKFLLEGEEPEVETIFVEDEDDVDIKPERKITYDVLDTEIDMLRSAIQNSLVGCNEEVKEETESLNVSEEEEEDTESAEDVLSESETIPLEIETVDTIRGDYSNLLERYRQRCMDRSESYGAISTTLVTPRETQTLTSSRSRSLGNEGHNNASINRNNNGSETPPCYKIVDDTKALNTTMLSDSGHGSVDNLSELSRSTSQARSDVPKLDLGGSSSDLGLGSGRSDVTVTPGDGDETEDDKGGKTLLELVCDQLSPIEQRQKPAKRREIEEDVSGLKVVATTKSLSKNSKVKSSSSGSIQAPFPPVCFKINARPPKGYLYYFAYGPDMNPNRFSSYIQRSTQDRYWGLLFGFNLVFNKRGTSEEAGGFANIEFNPLRSVEGCVYKITQQELKILDQCVGYPQHYEHLVLPVWLSNSLEPDNLGVAQYCVPALTYIAQNKWTETDKPLNSDYALSQCIKSADIVTTAYKDSLVAMASQQEVMASA
ncbi:uncharacterized protein LOC132716115 isoform X2 [Ruditapes philippinarum]|uniref:uncharacterized protein LOC132716115 isoform X2 n=1 Tax=Ruditapes philippinarum TaxID=129788 RepID=UPI00295C2A0A|nr:uncharacterized protein LOC132716115 isoform X2 [Ruditapes philippinarum]